MLLGLSEVEQSKLFCTRNVDVEESGRLFFTPQILRLPQRLRTAQVPD